MKSAPFILTAAMAGMLAACGSGTPSQPNQSPTPITPPPTSPSPPPTGIVLPPGMVCDPTPPPLHYLHVKIHDDSGDRKVLDSKPVVENVDNYCDRTHQGSGKFCDTRLEDDPQRTACDYLMTGISPATGRWGPTWTWNGKPCGTYATDETFTSCANHQSNQFMVIAKTSGKYVACANPDVPVAPGGSACGEVDIK